MLDMKAKELRIGNIIPISGEVKQEIYHHNDEYHNSDYAELFEVSEGYVSFYVNHGNDYPWSIPIEGVKPIVLTPKVLEACKLNQNGKIYSRMIEYYARKIMVGITEHPKYYVAHIHGLPLIKLTYLHELQNWWYWNTGEELVINVEKLK